MLVFIDDSGDPGFKLDRGSTPFFVIALVIFEDELEATKRRSKSRSCGALSGSLIASSSNGYRGYFSPC
jgi:hypothetical protein